MGRIWSWLLKVLVRLLRCSARLINLCKATYRTCFFQRRAGIERRQPLPVRFVQYCVYQQPPNPPLPLGVTTCNQHLQVVWHPGPMHPSQYACLLACNIIEEHFGKACKVSQRGRHDEHSCLRKLGPKARIHGA